jgi:hypothetical protein
MAGRAVDAAPRPRAHQGCLAVAAVAQPCRREPRSSTMPSSPPLNAISRHDSRGRSRQTFKGANHEPVVKIVGPMELTARAGQTVRLPGAVTDPDRDDVTVRWWHYQDAGTFPGEVLIPSATSLDTTFQIPGDAQPGQTIHVILEATDSGTPSLTRYQRVIVTVGP